MKSKTRWIPTRGSRVAPKIHIPFTVVAELRAGFAVGSRGEENQRIFEQFLHRPRVEVLLPTIETTRHYAYFDALPQIPTISGTT